MSSAKNDFWTSVHVVKRIFQNWRREEGSDDSGDENPAKGNRKAVPKAKYQYTALSEAESCIRLLELRSGHHHDLITCRLSEVGLNESANQYDALSYVWGPPGGNTTLIQVNDGSLEIGFSLHCALKNLRHSNRSRFLWVDAICIDQSSNVERNIQVPLMCEVYQNAACTICFLGPKRKTTRAMYAMLEELAQEGKTLAVNAPVQDDTHTLSAFLNHLPIHPAKSKLFDKYMGDFTIVDIARCQWWYRAWTVQELMLSSNALMMTGRYTITWENFCAAVDHGINIQIWAPIAFGFIPSPVVVPYLSIRALMSRHHLPHQMGLPAIDFLNLLIHCRHRESTDPKDKIYAVLGLLRSMHPEALKPERSHGLSVELEYGDDVVNVYRRMSQELIHKIGNLDIMGVCPRPCLALPSWVTDWSIIDRIATPLMQDSLDRARVTHATTHTKADARFSDDGTRMAISGHEMTSVISLTETLFFPILNGAADAPKVEVTDYSALVSNYSAIGQNTNGLFGHFKVQFKILMILIQVTKDIFMIFITILKDVFKMIYIPQDDDYEKVMSVFGKIFAWERFAAAQTPTNPGGSSDDVYWQTLCAGTYKDGSIEETRLLYKDWSHLLQSLRTFIEKYPKTSERIPLIGIAIYMRANWQRYSDFWPYISCSQYRRLGRTENGWLCLLPKEAKEGDIIILARGGRVPLVIRVDEKKCNLFIGEAYIHGIMDGEAFDKRKCTDIELQ